jgi:predicted GH43/DUF377 family glycosyl hydrolase
MDRLGVLMTPEDGNLAEAEGVLNPAAVRGKDGQLYLFPRLVAKGNYSRIGIARVLFDKAGDPKGVERMGFALSPEEDYERRSGGLGGCEDPRVVFVEELDAYIMTYVAFSDDGPRVAIAYSKDLIKWTRLGRASFSPYDHIHFDGVPNKDSALFPAPIPNPNGKLTLGLLHRPLFPGTRPEEKAKFRDKERDLHRESIWISYSKLSFEDTNLDHIPRFTSHHRLASPIQPWEALKIGVGTPPTLCRHGWLGLYHGVADVGDKDKPHLQYSAGVLILREQNVLEFLYRSHEPVLQPELPEEKIGAVADVVFPTGIDRRDDLGQPDRFDVYYGMADDRIGVARLEIPVRLPHGGRSDPNGD